jgi:DNA-binding NtrC family response regulator
VIVATHRDLQERVRHATFREDLYYRLAVVPLDIPPLRERREDIPVLVESLLKQISRELTVRTRSVTAGALEKLRGYDFPGNIRELRNLLERACILATGDEISADDLILQSSRAPHEPENDWIESLPDNLDLPLVMNRIESELVRRALKKADGIQAEAARHLGISRSDLAYKIKKARL